MSEIFYSNVDFRLREELNARANAGKTKRDNRHIAYMTEKIANVEIVAFKPKPSGSKLIHGDEFDAPLAKLGGTTVRDGRYLPSGETGYLNSSQATYKYKQTIIQGEDRNLTAVPVEKTGIDNSRRIAPFIKVADITIGDGGMGLLNKANLAISIPNPTRDLDQFESIWMRPGRYVRLTVQHPKSATLTEGLLSDLVIPNEEKLKQLYPKYVDNLEELKKRIRKMNEYTFSGLVTSFDLSYDADASVSVTLQLTGTSDIYTDISMFMSGDQKTKNSKLASYSQTENTGSAGLRNTNTSTTASIARVELYDKLSQLVEEQRLAYLEATKKPGPIDGTYFYEQEGIIPFKISEQTNSTFNKNSTDSFILFGQPFSTNINRTFVYEPQGSVREAIIAGSIYINPTKAQQLLKKRDELQATANDNAVINPPVSINALNQIPPINAELDSLRQQLYDQREQQENEQIEQFQAEEKQIQELTDENRYITLGALIHFLNNEIIRNKQGSENEVGVICTDALITSPFYRRLRSVDPEKVLLLSKNPDSIGALNAYGNTLYYKNVIDIQQKNIGVLQDKGLYREWQGIAAPLPIELTNRQRELLLEGANITLPPIPEKNTMYPSRIFINLESIKSICDALSNKNSRRFTYGNFVESISSLISSTLAGAVVMKLTADKTNPENVLFADSKDVQLDAVIPYRIPMFANDSRGTIVRDFQFSAKLPSSVKNLSYVLNQGTDISTEEIAPYMNFMFNADNPETLNTVIASYTDTHDKTIQELLDALALFGRSPQDTEARTNLRSAMKKYLQYPTPDVRKSQQIVSPIFPFDASFTIDGINGFRYGDVLEFPGLPKKYTENTVFLITSIVHNISSEGTWTSKISCIMRPNI